ncbi:MULTISPECIES: asparaginase [unclassified Pseudonocardia]|jgi:L-asparaginase II|uniref:asparaginase n=1 Tax=unclassified Pseudonocardia TaxID=2619320 RepID=UPI000960478C|nr:MULTISPECIES: asparaginase [unclassified Pseudonocardia]MBN9096503.1 asparaginase [Pseudonocardia sp.]OJY54041.1 MAG: asparaginase [Pseudonocardia sp. 73-21]
MSEKAEVLAEVVRGDVVESVHLGHLVALDAHGVPVRAVGDPGVTFYPRSSLKPVQAVAMLRAGLDLDGEQLALAAASHSGEPAHLDGVRAILAGAGLTEADLQNTPAPPWDAEAAYAWRVAGHGPSSLVQNCSGKHAAMLATCVAAGWEHRTYLEPGHPLQQAIRASVAGLTGDGDPAHTSVDGCGAPLFSCTVAGLARAFARIATAADGTPEHRVATAIREHPWFLGGTGREVTAFIEGVPGLIAKDGADGVFAAALPDGRALALKVLDGSPRPVPVVVAGALRALDVPLPDGLGRVDVLGHGRSVGTVRSPLPGHFSVN